MYGSILICKWLRGNEIVDATNLNLLFKVTVRMLSFFRALGALELAFGRSN